MEQETWNQISGIALLVSAIICIISIYFLVKAYKEKKITVMARAAGIYAAIRNLDRQYPCPSTVWEARKFHIELSDKIKLFKGEDLTKAIMCAKRDALADYIKSH